MITLTFKDQHSSVMDEYRLEVPDFPYTLPFCADGREVRLCISPLEFDTARGDIKAFLSRLPAQVLENGIHRMSIIHDEIGLLTTWYNVNILSHKTPYGYELEISTLREYVKV